MNPFEIRDKLNEVFKDKYIFEVTDNEETIFGWVDDKTFKNVVVIADANEDSFKKILELLNK